jgi:hypothetical protein
MIVVVRTPQLDAFHLCLPVHQRQRLLASHFLAFFAKFQEFLLGRSTATIIFGGFGT